MPDLPEHPPAPNLAEIGAAFKPQLVSSQPSDRELAHEIKQRMMEALKPVLEELGAAKALGFDVQFAIGTDAFARATVNQMKVIKEF